MENDTLGLYGPEDSKYLRLVARRAEAEGIKTAWVAGPIPAAWPMSPTRMPGGRCGI